MTLTPDREEYYLEKMQATSEAFFAAARPLSAIKIDDIDFVAVSAREELERRLPEGAKPIIEMREKFLAEIKALEAEMNAEGVGHEFERLALIVTGKIEQNLQSEKHQHEPR